MTAALLVYTFLAGLTLLNTPPPSPEVLNWQLNWGLPEHSSESTIMKYTTILATSCNIWLGYVFKMYCNVVLGLWPLQHCHNNWIIPRLYFFIPSLSWNLELLSATQTHIALKEWFAMFTCYQQTVTKSDKVWMRSNFHYFALHWHISKFFITLSRVFGPFFLS